MTAGPARLLYVTSTMPFGAKETFIVPEVDALRKLGHEVTIVPMRPQGPVVHEDARRLLPATVGRPLLSLDIALAAVAEAARSPRRFARVLGALTRSRNPRVLAKNLAALPKGLWLARVARQRGADHIHAHWISTSATLAYVAHLASGIPWSITAHRWDIAEDNLVADKAASAAFVRAINVLGAEELARRAGGAADRICVVHMGVPLPERSAPPPRREGPLRVLVAANLVTVKGHRYAIDAARELLTRGTAVELHLAGDGPLRGELERQVSASGLESAVRFLGVVPHDELLRRMQQREWDVALLASTDSGPADREGIPVFLVEAMAAGIPVVASATGGIPELVTRGAGVLVPQRDGVAIADAIGQLADDDERARVGEAGRARVAEAFSVSAVAAELSARFSGAATDGASYPTIVA